jgi:uncharacterized membrane protein YeaQ/YmgE (transglycosylase-associated protein family)
MAHGNCKTGAADATKPASLEVTMGIIGTIVFGLIVGIIAKFLMPGDNEPKGFVLTAILGIVGSFVGTFLGQAVGRYKPGEEGGWIAAIIGAVILLWIWGMIVKRKQKTH